MASKPDLGGLAPTGPPARLGRALYYSLRYAADLVGTRGPGRTCRREAAFAPNAGAQLRVMDGWSAQRDRGPGRQAQGSGGGARAVLLFVRSHWIKMPLGVLLRHAAVKLVHRMRERNQPKTG